MIALLVSVSIVAVGASLRVQLLGTMTPNLFFFSYTLLTLAMLIVGGRGGVTGALLGVVVITAGNELTRYLASVGSSVPGLAWLLREGLSDLFLGGAMLGFMILRPGGLLRDLEIDDLLRPRGPVREPERPAERRDRHASRRLAAAGLTVDFGGFRALRGASVEVEPDEIVGLIGPNGAGKTTALNAVTGLVPLTEGRITLGERELTGRAPHRIAREGLARTFQSSRLFRGLSVEENVAVAAIVAERHRGGRPPVGVDELVRAAGLWEVRERRAGELDHGSARRLELARAAALRPEILLLDEPVAGMSEAESFAMIERVRSTARSVGAGVLVIDHDLHFITTICDRIYVLDQGRVIAHGRPEEIKADAGVRRAYLGTGGAPSAGVV
jgi:branched-chain amino acid transport system permease protein